ncbi:hypothetical protein C2845_PM07G03150 [Panicum miliaceum]|uniref:Uncharacterized protein n=1 Tax=Panicum miliaceum TaxID=4540 RepID=A0A3L6SU02_PANMI|nr:hypothetical protein C2845_PM07G03150 [Panicum miliaceum]
MAAAMSTDNATLKMSAATVRRPLGPPRSAPSKRTPWAPLLVTRIRPRAAGGHLLELRDDVACRVPSRESHATVPVAPRGAPSNRGERSNPAEREIRWNAFSVSGGSSSSPPSLAAQAGSAGGSVTALTGLATEDRQLLEPRRLDDLGNGDACVPVGVEQPGDEPSRLRGQPRRAVVIHTAHLPEHGGDIVLLERERAGEEHVEDDPARPDVGLGAVGPLPEMGWGQRERGRAAIGGRGSANMHGRKERGDGIEAA